MTRLDKAANELNRLAKRMAAEKIKKEKTKHKMWNGKKIIPLAEWEKKQNFNTHEWRDYYPDKYRPNLLLYPGDDEMIQRYQDEWWTGYSEYVESIKDPEFGKIRCNGCIFNPDALPRTTNIRDAIITTYQKPDKEPVEFPCKIVNLFKCPYKDDEAKTIFFLGAVWKFFDDALKYNRKMIIRIRNTYSVDFEKKKVILVWHHDHELQHGGNVEEFFSKIKSPKFQITDHKSLYDVITTRNKLQSVLEEYLDAIAIGIENNKYVLKIADHFREHPEDFLDVFDKIKNAITFEKLQDTDGMTLQQEEERSRKYKEFLEERKGIEQYFSPVKSEPMHGTCFSCSQFANVKCINCKIWTCLTHWRDHGIQTHNYTKPENSSSSNV